MLPEGSLRVPANYGVTPLWEADFLLVVKDAGINTAKTREVVADRHLRGYRPFIELADRGWVPDTNLALDQWKALNVSGRAGIAGKEVPLPQTKDGFDRLAAMVVEAEVTGPNGPSKRTGVARETLATGWRWCWPRATCCTTRACPWRRATSSAWAASCPPRRSRRGETVTVRYNILARPDTVKAVFR